MFASASLTTLLLLVLSRDALGAPTASTAVVGRSMPIRRLNPSLQNLTQVAQKAKDQRDILAAKYGGQSLQQRGTGYNLYVKIFMSWVFHPQHRSYSIVNQGIDTGCVESSVIQYVFANQTFSIATMEP
jgi:hypothetical protein